MAQIGEDGVARCPWAGGPGAMREYHDNEWGVPVRGEAAYLERMTLEAFQSGLSWAVILAKRPGFRAAFADFDAEAIAAYDDLDVERLLLDAGIVRNRRKIEATITNARATVDLREHGGLEEMVLGFRPEPVYTKAIDFLRQNGTATETLTLDEAWAGGSSPNLKKHYTQSRLRATVALILCSPDALRR